MERLPATEPATEPTTELVDFAGICTDDSRVLITITGVGTISAGCPVRASLEPAETSDTGKSRKLIRLVKIAKGTRKVALPGRSAETRVVGSEKLASAVPAGQPRKRRAVSAGVKRPSLHLFAENQAIAALPAEQPHDDSICTLPTVRTTLNRVDVQNSLRVCCNANKCFGSTATVVPSEPLDLLYPGSPEAFRRSSR